MSKQIWQWLGLTRFGKYIDVMGFKSKSAKKRKQKPIGQCTILVQLNSVWKWKRFRLIRIIIATSRVENFVIRSGEPNAYGV